MALFNYSSKEITLKVVFYGPGLCGKTTNLQHLHSTYGKTKLLSLSTEADRTLFFDFLPVDLGKIKDFTVRFQLYTVPGQVRYNATRKLVLKGADAIIFVADSQRELREQNIESLQNMRDNLNANNIDPDNIPVLLQFNKRDLKNILTEHELNRDLNTGNYKTINAAAIDGTGVQGTFDLIIELLLADISKKHNIEIAPPSAEQKAKAASKPDKSATIDIKASTATETFDASDIDLGGGGAPAPAPEELDISMELESIGGVSKESPAGSLDLELESIGGYDSSSGSSSAAIELEPESIDGPSSTEEPPVEAVAEAELEAIAEAEPEAIAEVEPEAIAEVEPEAIAEVEPEAIAEAEPEAIAEVEPEAIAEVEALSADEPVEAVEALETVGDLDMEIVGSADPFGDSKPVQDEPVEATGGLDAEPLETSEPVQEEAEPTALEEMLKDEGQDDLHEIAEPLETAVEALSKPLDETLQAAPAAPMDIEQRVSMLSGDIEALKSQQDEIMTILKSLLKDSKK